MESSQILRPSARLFNLEEKEPPVIAKNANPCEGCFANWWRKAIDFGEGIFSVSRFAVQIAADQRASEDDQKVRETVCRACPLFNTIKDGVFSCGKPVTERLFRIRGKEGCGCWLNLKWLGKSEKCPLEPPKW